VIFVTVGTTGFDELVQQIDHLVKDSHEEFIIQVGPGTYLPRNCQYFRYESSLDSYFESANVVVSHGGLATVTEVLATGKPLVAVEDHIQPDRHQQEILRVWNEEGYLLWCEDMTTILECIQLAKSMRFVPYSRPECDIPNVIHRFIDTFG
jgi:beta-1,4-N-acetylglucosaminyltransferase